MSASVESGGKRRGRPQQARPAEISAAALHLFAERGFQETTLEQIAAKAKIGRRTLFRYFPSKNDIVWGEFDLVLERLRHHLEASPPDAPLMEVITSAVIETNRYDSDELPVLRIRMMLITSVPALQAHSAVRYAEWRDVVAEFAAKRLGQQPNDLLPLMFGYGALGASRAAFARWVSHEGESLEESLRACYAALSRGLSAAAVEAEFPARSR